MKLRTISRMIVIALVVLVGAVALIHQRLAFGAPSGGSAPASGSATAPAGLVGGDPLSAVAPGMSLRDQNGNVVTTASLQGRPAIVTFMDMTCTQACPIYAQLLNQTAQFMGTANAQKVSWIVVSVNPNNTPADTAAFMRKNNVTIPVKVLLGSKTELAPVWQAYKVHPATVAGSTDVQHEDYLYIIDSSGHERMVFPQGWDPMTLSQDLMSLLTTK